MSSTEYKDQCPRCGAHRLRGWRELTAEEREVARRLSVYGDDENMLRDSSWCARCWYERTGAQPRTV